MRRRAVERLEQADWRETETEKIRNAASTYEESNGSEYLERIPVRQRDTIVLVPVDEVASIVADGELLHITTVDNKKHTINYRLKDLELRLTRRTFVAVVRRAVANL